MTASTLHLRVTEQDKLLAEKTARSIGAGGALVAHDHEGRPFEITGSVLDTIREVLSRAAESDEYLLVSRQAELSPEEAAKVLGVSRPTVYHRMDSGRLPFRDVGTHRRVRVKDVLALKAFEIRQQRFSKAMSEDTDAQEPVFGD